MSSTFDDIKTGLTQAVEFEQGKLNAKTTTLETAPKGESKHKTLEERLADFYGAPIEEAPRVESSEYGWDEPIDTAHPEAWLDPNLSDDERIDAAARHILQRYKPAFMELAK